MVNPTLLRRVGLRTRGVVEAALRFPGHPPGSRRDDDSSVVSRIEKHRARSSGSFQGHRRIFAPSAATPYGPIGTIMMPFPSLSIYYLFGKSYFLDIVGTFGFFLGLPRG